MQTKLMMVFVAVVFGTVACDYVDDPYPLVTTTDGGVQTDAGADTDAGTTDAGTTPAPTTYTVTITSNVPSNPTVYIEHGGGRSQFKTTGSIELTPFQFSQLIFSVNGTSKHGIKIYAQNDDGTWWDCESPFKKKDNLSITMNGVAMPATDLEMFNNGQACSGQGAGDLFITAPTSTAASR